MSNEEGRAATDAAIAVFTALQGLSAEEQARVLNSAAALYGVSLTNVAAGLQVENSLPAPPVGESSVPGKRISIVELLQDKNPATNSQRIAAFAYYLEKYEGASRFAKADLAPFFAKAKLPKPGNFDRDYSGAIKEGWIHDEGVNSYLTQKGEAAVEAGFGGKAKARGSAVAKKKKPSKPND